MVGEFLMVQWLGLQAFTAKDVGSVLVRELRSFKLHGAAREKKKLCHAENTFQKIKKEINKT